MAKLARRTTEKTLEEKAHEVEDQINEPLPERDKPIDLTKTVSTGSTLLDLTISGRRRREGGIPGGIIVEIYGKPSSGKTALLSEIVASTQSRGGSVKYLDPEGRLDLEYSRIYGMTIEKKDYYRPNTVEELFDKHIKLWEPKTPDAINTIAADSLAALSSELEMEKGDKFGMRRAKLLSTGCRTTARDIANNNWLIICSNQVRDGEYGETIPGGNAIPFYASLMIRVNMVSKIERTITLKNRVTQEDGSENKRKDVEVKNIIGIESACFIKKSSIDRPYRTCSIYILDNYGIDDVRGNLQYLKDMKGDTVYDCFDGKTYVAIDKAITYIEENNLKQRLKENVIDQWNEIEDRFKVAREPKIRT